MGRRLDQLLLTDLSPHHRDLLTAAAEIPSVAGALAAGFDDPRTLYRWWFEEAEAHRFLAEKRAQHAARFDGRELRRALGQYATGVTVVTARAPDGRNVGMTANSFASVSLEPPLVLWCPGKNSPSLPDFTDASHFAVHVLAADQHHLSRQFATPADDKFRGTPTTAGIAGTPSWTARSPASNAAPSNASTPATTSSSSARSKSTRPTAVPLWCSTRGTTTSRRSTQICERASRACGSVPFSCAMRF